MDVKKKAHDFAINAYSNKYRKAELDKPYFFHAIDVANKLEKYGFDDNVVAAGYLHDIIEDTEYSEKDVLDMFGEDITSLVMGATERDKSLSWEERKIDSIQRVRNLDIRHKAIVACDKISNIEDLRLKFGKNGKEDFSSFNRGKDKKIWYWKEIYKSLITGEDENLPMFLKLKKNIDDISNISNVLAKGYYPDIDVIDSNLDTSKIARELHYKKNEMLKIMTLVNNKKSYVVEFTGDNSEEKSSMIYKLKTYFMLSGFNVLVVNDLNEVDNSIDRINDFYDIVLIDRAFFDKVTNMYIMNKNGVINYSQFNNYIYHSKKKIIDYIDMVVVLKNKDDYCYNSSLYKCINRYIDDTKVIYSSNNYKITNDDLLEISSIIIDSMRNKYLKQAKQTYIINAKKKLTKNV